MILKIIKMDKPDRAKCSYISQSAEEFSGWLSTSPRSDFDDAF